MASFDKFVKLPALPARMAPRPSSTPLTAGWSAVLAPMAGGGRMSEGVTLPLTLKAGRARLGRVIRSYLPAED